MRDPDDEGDDARRPEDARQSIRQEITRLFGEPAALDALRAMEAALPDPPPEPTQRSGLIIVAPLVILVGLVGIVVRVVVLPFRGLLRRRAERAAVARLDAERRSLRDAHDKLVDQPDNVEARTNLAVMLADYNPEIAERELDHVVRTTPETTKPHAVALHNRGIMRTRLELVRLGRADADRAKELGFTLKPAPLLPSFLWFVFKLTAGLQLDR